MGLTFTGTYPAHKRIETGCLSFDWAIAGQNFQKQQLLGIPLHCGIHIYSKETGVGKTALSLALLGIVAASEKKGISISPVDTFDQGNLEAILTDMGMEGEVNIILTEPPHNKMLKKLQESYKREDICGALLDSVYACQSVASTEGDPGDANVGQEAKMIASFVNQMYAITNNPKQPDKVFILTNMLFPAINSGARKGFGPPPMITGRGVKPNSLTSLHIKLTQQYRKNKAVRADEGRLIHGVIEKNNFGPPRREFDVYMVGGHGIHRGLTAVFDCLTFGIAKDASGGKVEVDGYSAKLSKMIADWDTFDFTPYTDAIAEFKKSVVLAGKQVEVVSEEVENDEIEQSSEDLFNG